jgi:hypothetical protein
MVSVFTDREITQMMEKWACVIRVTAMLRDTSTLRDGSVKKI